MANVPGVAVFEADCVFFVKVPDSEVLFIQLINEVGVLYDKKDFGRGIFTV